MKKSDFIFLLVATAIFLPFFVSDDAYEWYKTFNATHGMVMSFLKFAILSTMGEMIGLRISTGVISTGLSESFPDGGMGTAWHGHQYGNDYLLKRSADVYGIYGYGKCFLHHQRRDVF